MRVPPVNCVTTKDCDSNNATLKTSECGKCINDSRPRHTLNKAVLEVDQVQYISNVCVRKLASLATTVQGLKCFIHRLVERETKFVQMFKIADNMWLQMESQYQNMIKASKENEAVLLDDVNKIEKSFGKYSAGCKNLENEFNEIKESEGKLRRAVEEKEDKLNCLTEQNAVLKRRLDILNEEIKMHGDNNDINKQKLMDIQNYAAQIKHLQSEIDYEEKNCMCIEGLYKERLTNMRVEIEKSYKLLTELNISNECYQSQINNELMDQHSILESIKRCSDKRDTDMARLVQNHGQKHKPLLKDHNRNELGTSVTDLEPICDTCTCGTICRNQCVCLYVKTRFLENIFDKISDVLYEELHTNLPTISEQIMGQNLESDAMRRNTEDKLKEFVIESVAGSLDDTIMAAIVKTNCEMTLEINNMLQDCVKRAVEGNRPHRPPAVNIYRFKDYGQGPSKEPKEEDECSIGCAGRNSRSQNKTAGKKKNQRTKSSEKRCCQKSRNVGIKTMVQGCNMAVDPCKCLPTESFGVKLMEQGAQMNFDACKCVPTEGVIAKGAKLKSCKCVPTESVERTGCIMSQTKETGCTVVGNTPVQCYNLPIERGLYNTAKIGANLETCKCLPTESVERTGCIISQAKEAGTTTDGNDPAQCYNLPIELGANDTGKVDAMDFNTCHCVPIESGGAKVTDLDECKCVPTESVEKTIRIMSLTKESGTTMVKLDTCKCLPAESVKLDTCKCVSTDSVKLDNCKCVPTESVERTGCIMSQANEAGSTTQVGNAPVQCYNLPIEVGEKAGEKMMDLDACKCVPTESVERTGCIISQAAEGESTMEAKIDKWPVQCYNLPTEGADNTLYSMPQHKDHIVASVQYQTMPQIQDINMDCAPSQSRNNKDITYAPNSKENDAPAAFEISEEYPAKYIRHVSTSRSIVTPKSECIQEQVITDSEMFEKALYEITISSEMDQMKGTEVRLSSTNIKFSEYEQLEEQQRGTETNDMKSFSVKSSSSVGEADCDIVKCSIFTEGSTCCPSEQQKQCNRNRKKLKKKRHEKLQLSSHPKNDFNFAINFAEDILALIEKQFKYLISEEDSEKLMSKSSSKHISSKLRNLIDTYDATASSNANNQLNNVDKAEKSRQNNFDEQSIDSSKKCACKIESNFTTKKLCPAQANVKKNQFEKGESNQLNKVNETVLDTCISSEASKSKRKPALKPTSGSYPHHIVVNNKSFYSSCRTQLPLFLRDMSSH